MSGPLQTSRSAALRLALLVALALGLTAAAAPETASAGPLRSARTERALRPGSTARTSDRLERRERVRSRARRSLVARERAWRQRGETRDVTDRFTRAYRKAEAGHLSLPREAHDYVYLLVPGVMGNQLPGYMSRLDSRLEGLGLEVHRARVDTLGDVRKNADALGRQILELSAGGKRVVLITHSKGGVDALAADALHPEIRQHIRARVLMQPPYGGSYLAPLLDNPFARTALRAVGGDGRMISDMRPDQRRRFAAEHPHSTDIPTLTLAASSGTTRSALGPLAGLARLAGQGRTDVMIARQAQIVPGSHVVLLDDMDHAGPVLRLPGRHYQPGAVGEALIATALALPDPR